MEFNRAQFAPRQAADARIREAQTQFNTAQQLVTELTDRRALLTRFWHYFKRRDLDHRLVGAGAAVALALMEVEDARAALAKVEAQQPPEFPGLSVDARRAINIAAVAYAEVLWLRLADTSLMSLAREAMGHREPVDAYGARTECEALIALIARARVLLESKVNVAQDVKTRSDDMRQRARYRNAVDTSPTAESVAPGAADVMPSKAPGTRAAIGIPNVLGEDTWDLYRVLLR